MKKILVASVLATLAACGGGGGGGSTAVSQPVQAANRAPVIVDPGTLTVSEGATAVATITASDADNDSLTFSIASGDDQSLFSIDASTGALSFSTAPDFESPGDSGSDNVYGVTVQVSDGVLSDSQSLSITVSDTLAFEETSLVVNVPVDALQSACPGDGVQQQFVLPVNLNGDSLIDFISHYWCQRTDFAVVDDGPTPDLLVAYVSNSNGSYDAANESVFGDANAKLGGASRNLDSGDLNGDGKPDFAFAMNREDLRRVDNVDDIAIPQTVLMSTQAGYDVQRLGEADWGHAVGVYGSTAYFAGYRLQDAQVFTFRNGAFEDVSANGFTQYDAAAFDIGENFIVNNESRTTDGRAVHGIELLRRDGTSIDEYLYEEQFKIEYDLVAGGVGFVESAVFAKENGDLFFQPAADEVQIFESNGELLVAIIYDTFVYSGAGTLVSGQRVEGDEWEPKKEIFLFKIENDVLVSKNDHIEYSFGADFVQFFEVVDLDGENGPDIQFSVMDTTCDDSLVDGVPRVFLNDGENNFAYVSDEDFIRTPMLECGGGNGGSARGFVTDVNGDGLMDFVRFTFISKIESVKLEVYLATFNFYD